MKSTAFIYHGLKINVSADNGTFVELLNSYHDFILCDDSIPFHKEIFIRVDSGKAIEKEYFGTVCIGDKAVMTRASGKKMTEVIIDPHSNNVVALLPEPDKHIIEAKFEAIFMQPLKYLAKKYGIFFMHASSVALDSKRGIIFLGDQHAGKSTMALNLLLNGYCYVAEESPAICIENGEAYLYGFPEPIGVSEQSLKNFPELKKYCKNTTEPYLKHRIKFDTISPGRIIQKCRPCAIFLPEYRENNELEFKVVNKIEALQRILTLELECFTDEYNRTLTQKHMNALGTLVQNTATYQLFYNDNHLPEIPDKITELISS